MCGIWEDHDEVLYASCIEKECVDCVGDGELYKDEANLGMSIQLCHMCHKLCKDLFFWNENAETVCMAEDCKHCRHHTDAHAEVPEKIRKAIDANLDMRKHLNHHIALKVEADL